MMKTKYGKSTMAVLTIIMLVILFTGCGDTDGRSASPSDGNAEGVSTTESQPSKVTQASADTQEAGAVQKYPMKVTDANGYEMIIPSEPQRIVSLTLGSDEVVLGLVDTSRILALTQYADDPAISNVAGEAAKISERATMDKVENVIAMNPDLVILDTWADVNYVKQLRDAGINVFTFKTPNNIEEQKAVIAELAKITGADDRGREMLEWMDSKLKTVEEKLAKLRPEEKLVVMDYGEMGSSGIGTNVDDIFSRAGLINAVSRAGMKGWPQVSKEKIIEFNPDIIVLPSWYYDQSNSLQGMIDRLKGDKSLQTVNAVKNNRLISVPNPHISAISQYVVLGVEDVAKAAYPELFK